MFINVNIKFETNKLGADAIPKMQVDKGGIKKVLGGANVMAPGLLTSGIRTHLN